MITIQQHPELHDIANFISKLNPLNQHHIGYCGKEADEILNTLEEDFTDIEAKDAFVTATNENKIVGVCGFDVDMERGYAELWGPFVEQDDSLEITKLLWNELTKKKPSAIHTVSLFPDNHNKMALDFGRVLGFSPISEQTILTFTKGYLKEMTDDPVIKLSKLHYSSVVTLHDQMFPDTYLSGEEMVEGLNEEAALFGRVDNRYLLGYLYAEAEPEFAEGSIEFFAVDPSVQSKGVGSALLKKGLQWLFSFPSIDETSLCVRSDNSKAIHLYKKIGFQVEHELTLFEKKL